MDGELGMNAFINMFFIAPTISYPNSVKLYINIYSYFILQKHIFTTCTFTN